MSVDWERAATSLCVRRIRRSPRDRDPGIESIKKFLRWTLTLTIIVLNFRKISMFKFRKKTYAGYFLVEHSEELRLGRWFDFPERIRDQLECRNTINSWNVQLNSTVTIAISSSVKFYNSAAVSLAFYDSHSVTLISDRVIILLHCQFIWPIIRGTPSLMKIHTQWVWFLRQAALCWALCRFWNFNYFCLLGFEFISRFHRIVSVDGYHIPNRSTILEQSSRIFFVWIRVSLEFDLSFISIP